VRFRRGGSGRSRTVDTARLEAAFREALSALLDEEPDRAEAALAAVVQDDSSQVEVYLALGQLYRRRGEIGRAIRVHQNLLLRSDLDDEHRERALRGLARDFRKGGFLTRAIAAWEELRDRSPRDAETLAALARLRADTRDFDGALDAHRRWARASGENGKPGEAALWLERAEAHAAEGRADEARRALAKSLKLAPGQARAWLRLGELEAERGKPKKALAAWKKALAADRRLGEVVYPRLEATLTEMGRAEQYERDLRARLEVEAEDAGARLALARCLGARGETAAALEEIEGLLAGDPERLDVQAARARLLLAAGREGEAAKALGALVSTLERGGLLAPREPLE
jgi:lipopolysaccharide biosynthesis regulator YciM